MLRFALLLIVIGIVLLLLFRPKFVDIGTSFPSFNEKGLIHSTHARLKQIKPYRRQHRNLADDGVIVFLGDSIISGEAGRWAGTTLNNFHAIDAGGETTYFDNENKTAEKITGCHRSNVIESMDSIRIANMACSGARTMSEWHHGNFKPGLDFYDDKGQLGHAIRLSRFASENNVKMVAVSIGANDFEIGNVFEKCMKNFLTSLFFWKKHGRSDKFVREKFSAKNVERVATAIYIGLESIVIAMTQAGYEPSQWTLLVQTYPKVLPESNAIRYAEIGFGRHFTGGCGFYNDDLDWLNSTALDIVNNTVIRATSMIAEAVPLLNLQILRLDDMLVGRRVCEKGRELFENSGFHHWTDDGAKDVLEWVNQARMDGPFHMNESLHPNYWAQSTLRDCIKRVYDGGDEMDGVPRGGIC